MKLVYGMDSLCCALKVRDEIHHIKSDMVTFESSREKRLLVERDDAVMELTHLKSQCRSLKDRLKVSCTRLLPLYT